MKKIKIERKYYAAAFTMAALAAFMPLGLTGCKPQTEVNATVSTEETEEVLQTEPAEDLKKETLTAEGSSGTMIESGRNLYFRYQNDIWSLNKKNEELKKLKSFEEGENSESFWIYGGNLYYDKGTFGGPDNESTYGLYKLNLETGEDTLLTELSNQANGIYASEGILYVSSYDKKQAYKLGEEGELKEELTLADTVYGKIPEGTKELYRGMLPELVERTGYMPVQNDTCLVIAKADGSKGEEVPEVTNTSAVLFDKDAFFVPFQDGSGNTQCYRYDADTLEKTLLFESSENPELMQVRDGYLYYQVRTMYQTVSEGPRFYKVDTKTGETSLAASLELEPGTLRMQGSYGNFYVTEDAVYCLEIKDYGVYIGKKEIGSKNAPTLIKPALYQSEINELGHVEAERKEIPCSCGDTEAVEVYAEYLVFDGEDEAAKAMNRVMKERYQSIIKYGEEMASHLDESWVHSADFTIMTLTYQIGEITYLDPRYACIQTDGYEYSGGAHGTSFRDYFLFDRETGALLKLKDVIENPVEDLQSIVSKAFRELAEKRNFAFESPEDLEHTVADDVSYDSKFYLTPEGVVFYYSPYEIAPYAEGYPEVTIPFDELKMKIELGK